MHTQQQPIGVELTTNNNIFKDI